MTTTRSARARMLPLYVTLLAWGCGDAGTTGVTGSGGLTGTGASAAATGMGGSGAAGGNGNAASPNGTGQVCPAGQTPCGSMCVNLTADIANCGACGVACVSGELCTSGQCVCQQGLTDCSGTCTTVLTDGSNCGSCGQACPTGEVCSQGQCGSTCAGPGDTACGSSCVDLTSSSLNCGQCGKACGAGQACQAGKCACSGTQQLCGDQCVDTNSNGQHCGGCDNECTGGQACTDGTCSCPGSGQLRCSGSCVDPQSDTSNCGACGTVCQSGESCTNGDCVPGDSTTGGTSAGGQNTGGVNTGGAGTGGTATGGQNTGGESTGGQSTGGESTGGQSTGGNATGFDPRNPPFILGADVSWIQEQEDQGRRFSDNGTQKDIFEILKDHGFNYIRLRVFHDPGASGGYQHEFGERAEPYCDTAHTIEVAKRIRAAGLGFSLDFHYSDTWADPGDQKKPQAWSSYGLSQLVTALHDYTVDTLESFEAAGALPDMVQVGNEITPGMLLPDGSSNNWANLSQLLKAGVAAVNEVDSGILKVMHIEGPHKPDTISWWTDSALQNGVEFDILGVSCYSAWHEGPTRWQSTFERVASEHPELKFMIAEYADNYRAANDIMHNLSQGIGTMFWEPTADGEWGRGLFESNGQSRSELSLYDQMATDYGLR